MSRDHDYWVYMMTNKKRTVLYTGVTNDVLVRVAQHRRGEIPGFTRDYHCVVLVYCSHFREALARLCQQHVLLRTTTGYIPADPSS